MTKANIYFFNPTCELAVANGSFSYMPPLLLQEMEYDLSILPLAFCTQKDIVLTETAPSAEFVQNMENYGFEMPEFCSLNRLEILSDHSFETISPWGWSPAAHFKFKNLKSKCTEDFKRSPVYNWKDEHKLLFERSASLRFLSEIIGNNPPKWFVNKEMLGNKINSCEEIEVLLTKHSPLVLKAPMSSSGRGIQIIRKPKLNTSNRQWISGILKQQKYIIAEPFLEKLFDLSFQFLIKDNFEVEYLGYSIFETNSNGQYKGTFIRPDLTALFPDEDSSDIIDKINETAFIIRNALSTSVYAKWHRGFLGVDSLFFKNQKSLMIQPCIEINSRMNMGILSLFLEKKIHPMASGRFELFFGKVNEYMDFVAKKTELFPPKLLDGKLHSGFITLVEPAKKNKFGAYISLGTAR